MTTTTSRSAPRRRTAAATAAIGVLALVVAGCGGGGAEAPAEARAPVPPMPASMQTGKPQLTLRGALRQVGTSGLLAFDMADLEAVGARRIEVDDPIEERHLSFIAVPLRAVLDRASPAATARTLHAWALDDYSVDIPMSVARDDDAWLATRKGDGSPLRLEDGGPLRVVFTDGSVVARLDSYWIWSVAILTAA